MSSVNRNTCCHCCCNNCSSHFQNELNTTQKSQWNSSYKKSGFIPYRNYYYRGYSNNYSGNQFLTNKRSYTPFKKFNNSNDNDISDLVDKSDLYKPRNRKYYNMEYIYE